MQRRVAPASAETFADNRAVGRIIFSVQQQAGVTRRARLREEGPLRLRCPKVPGGAVEAVIINTAGGIAGGDSLHMDISVAADARLTVTTAAAEKLYRSLGPDATMEMKLKVDAGAALAWLPQETILFDRARLKRTICIELANDAQLLFAEAIVFGRSGGGEQVEHGRLIDRWELHCDGRLLHAEATRFDGPIAEKLAQRAVTGGSIAVATVLIYPGDEKLADAIHALKDSFCGEVGVSAWKGMALARLCAPDGAALKRDLAKLLGSPDGAKRHPGTPDFAVAQSGLRVSLPRLWSS
jgi:urease accessory protein